MGLAGLASYFLFFRKSGAAVNHPHADVVTTDFPWDGTAPGVVAIPIGNPGPLMQGAHYLAKVVTTGLVSLVANPARVQSKAIAAGFSSVNVYEAGQVPAYFPNRTPAPSGTTYWLEGDYALPSRQKVFPTTVGITAWYLNYATHPVVPNLGYAASAQTASTAAALPAKGATS